MQAKQPSLNQSHPPSVSTGWASKPSVSPLAINWNNSKIGFCGEGILIPNPGYRLLDPIQLGHMIMRAVLIFVPIALFIKRLWPRPLGDSFRNFRPFGCGSSHKNTYVKKIYAPSYQNSGTPLYGKTCSNIVTSFLIN